MTIDDVFVIEMRQTKRELRTFSTLFLFGPIPTDSPLLVTHCVPLFGGYRPFIELHAGRYTVLIWAGMK